MGSSDADGGPPRQQGNQPARVVAMAIAVLVVIVSTVGSDPKALVGSLVVLVVATGAGTVAVRAIDGRRISRMPAGMLHTATGSLVLNELNSNELLRVGVTSVPRFIRWVANGRMSGRLEVTSDRMTWEPGRLARYWQVPLLDIPLESVTSVEVTSALLPFDTVTMRIHFARGESLTVETRGAQALRSALAQTMLGDEGRAPDPRSGPSWTQDPPTAPRPLAAPARLAPKPRIVLIAAWIILGALLFGPFDPGQETGNPIVDGAADVFIVVAVVAIGLTLARSRRAPHAGAVAAVIGLGASFGDLSLDGITGAEEIAAFTIFLLLCLVMAHLPAEEPPNARRT